MQQHLPVEKMLAVTGGCTSHSFGSTSEHTLELALPHIMAAQFCFCVTACGQAAGHLAVRRGQVLLCAQAAAYSLAAIRYGAKLHLPVEAAFLPPVKESEPLPIISLEQGD